MTPPMVSGDGSLMGDVVSQPFSQGAEGEEGGVGVVFIYLAVWRLAERVSLGEDG